MSKPKDLNVELNRISKLIDMAVGVINDIQDHFESNKSLSHNEYLAIKQKYMHNYESRT